MNLLALPGGGCFGVYQAAAIARVPPEYLAKVGAVAGTSIGSVIGLAVALDRTDGLLPFFRERAPRIFAGYGFRHFLKWPLPRYADHALNKALQDLFGTLPLGECRIPTWITAVHMSGRPKVYFSRNADDSTVPAWEVARASCAAPTFFARWHGLSDGGLVANNPVMVGLAGLRRECGYSLDQIRAFKLGTGKVESVHGEQRNYGSGPHTWTGNLKFIVSTLLDGASDVMNDYQAAAFLQPHAYAGADFVLRHDLDMDNPRTVETILGEYERDIEQAAIDLVRFLGFPGA